MKIELTSTLDLNFECTDSSGVDQYIVSNPSNWGSRYLGVCSCSKRGSWNLFLSGGVRVKASSLSILRDKCQKLKY